MCPAALRQAGDRPATLLPRNVSTYPTHPRWRHKDPVWRIVAADQRSPRDGRIIENLGQYNAQTDPSTINVDEEKVRLARQGRTADRTGRKLLARRASKLEELLEYLAQQLVRKRPRGGGRAVDEDDEPLSSSCP